MNKFLTVLASIACITLTQNLVTHAASKIPQRESSNNRTHSSTGNAIDKAEEFKPRQLIAQSCRNINLRPRNGRSLTLKRGTSGTTCGYKFHFQLDGNLVLYKSGQALWATGTDRRGEILVMQSDGNLVIYGGGRALWATNTDGNPGAFLAIQADGNLVIYKSNGQQPIWASNTAGAGQSTAPQPSQVSNSDRTNQFNSFVRQNNGNLIADTGGSYRGQCISLVKQWGAFIGRGQGFWPGDFPAPAFNAFKQGDKRMVGNDSNISIVSDWRQLQAGDIVIMKGFPSHTGIASGNNTGSQYQMFDQNSPAGSAAALQMYNGSDFIGGIRYN